MDILNCELKWIGGRCYRNLSTTSENVTEKPCRYGCYEDEPTCVIPDSVSQVVSENSGRSTGFFRVPVSVPQQFMGRICGAKHQRKLQIERETNTQIHVPARDSDADVVVSGTDESSVESGCLRIQQIVSQMRQREQFTHFVALPLNVTSLTHALEEFQEIILKTCSGHDIDEKLFQSHRKLHLTIAMLVLLNKKEMKQAEKVLFSCKDMIKDILQDEPLQVRVQGLEHMNDDASQVDVLYAKVTSCSIKDGHPNNRLQQLADEVAQRFQESGLMLQPQHQRVKVHMTVMNTKFREQRFATENTAKQAPRNPKQSFDASLIMKRYRDYNFGKVTVPSICVLQPRTCNKDGFYESIAELPLPSRV